MRRFLISTERIGPRRWCWAVIHPDLERRVTSEIVAHELVHAAVAVYRMNVRGDVRLGEDCGEREEQLAYIYGELYGSLMSHNNFP